MPIIVSLLLAASPEKYVSLEVQNAETQNVLRALAEVMRINLVMSDEVKGSVTLTLRNVKVRDAFAVVLQARGLGFEKSGKNVYRVAPLTTLIAEAEQRARLKEARELEGPLETRLIPVNYAKASELAPQVKAMLSARGTVTVDERTNTLIVRDVAR